jgi:hypothetical protein
VRPERDVSRGPPVMRFLALRTSLSFLPVGAIACTPSPPSNVSGHADSGATFGCQSDSRAEAYSANLQKAGTAGEFTFVLVASDPAPPARLNNTWTLKVIDKTGKPVVGATFPPLPAWAGWPTGVRPYMPDHGHASTAHPIVMSNQDGTYTITPLYLMMPGLWQITINVQSGTMTDTVQYSFCVAG